MQIFTEMKKIITIGVVVSALILINWRINKIEREVNPVPLRPSSQILKSDTDIFNRRNLDTTYLPLMLSEFRLNEEVGMTDAGGITRCGENLLLHNRLGTIFDVEYENNKIKVSKISQVDLGLSGFQETEKYKINQGTFRLHKIYCNTSLDKIFATHEFFDGSAARFQLSVGDLEVLDKKIKIKSWSVVWKSSAFVDEIYMGAAGGGGINEDDKNGIVFAVGDYNLDGVINEKWSYRPGFIAAQNDSSDYGKTWRFDQRTKRVNSFSKGHRNPQSIEKTTSNILLLVEHGPQGGDKLIKLSSDKNYGWPYNTIGNHYGTYQWKIRDQPNKYSASLFDFLPSIGISSVREIRNFHARWNGDLIVASLKAQTLYRTRLNKSRDGVMFVEPIFIGERMRDVAFVSEKMFIWTDSAKLLMLEVDVDKYEKNSTLQAVKYAELGECMKCHHLDVTNASSQAPTLSGILGRKIANDLGFQDRYSERLKSKNKEVWTEAKMREFLMNSRIFGAENMPGIDYTEEQAFKIIEIMKGL